MPALDWLELFDHHVINIGNTMRPYLKESILLVNAARSIQDQFRGPGTNARSGLPEAIQCVSDALKAARDPAVRYGRSKAVDEVFEKAKKEMRKFCTLDDNEPTKEDRKAANCLRAVKIVAEKASKLASSRGSTNFLVTFWPPDVRKSEDMRRTLAFTVEKGLKLDHFLARILQKSLDRKNRLPPINLIQNPGFFTRIPLTLKEFSEGNPERSEKHRHQSRPTLCQLHFQKEIKDGQRDLHLLLDPAVLPDSVLTEFDSREIKENYRNAWMLKEEKAYAAARENSGCLVLLDLKPPLRVPRPEPHPTRSETAPRRPMLQPQKASSHPPPPREPQRPPAKTGFFSELMQTLKRTDPSPPKSEPPPQPPEPEPTPEVYRSHNFMSPIRLEMVDVEVPKRRWFKRRS